MYTVNNTNIIITKNNNGELCVTPFVQDSETEYILTGEDKLILTVKSNPNSNRVILKKELTALNYDENDKLIFKFTPTDTYNLEPYHYCYDVVLYTSEGEFYTIIDMSEFKILPSITEYPVESTEGGAGE